ncbi:MAG: hypothetical protein JO034_30120 [Singulisphaera sp.]|nr:hypothetical protein [Singulisphaera sp.]
MERECARDPDPDCPGCRRVRDRLGDPADFGVAQMREELRRSRECARACGCRSCRGIVAPLDARGDRDVVETFIEVGIAIRDLAGRKRDVARLLKAFMVTHDPDA